MCVRCVLLCMLLSAHPLMNAVMNKEQETLDEMRLKQEKEKRLSCVSVGADRSRSVHCILFHALNTHWE